MVADRVTIDSLSYKEGAKAVHWESDEGTSFEMTDSAKTEIGTTITLYLNEDSYEFCNEYRAKEILDKYCSFMPIPIYFEAIKTAEEQARIDEAEKKAKEEEEKRKAEEAAKKAADGEAVEAETEAEPTEKAPELLSQSMRLLRFGQSIQMSVLMRNIRSFITEYSMITRSRCSGSI